MLRRSSLSGPLNSRRHRCRPHRMTFLMAAAAGFFLSPSRRMFSTAFSSLNVVVVSGTTRTEGPPHPILGPRVAKYIIRRLRERGNSVVLVDPRELADLPLLQKPAFAYAKSKIPSPLQELQQVLSNADAYVAITPEYNHAPSPALLNLFNHFGSSIFSFKPSAIVSYSAGQWGGTRAAIALRPFLSELGCLPVSAMIHVPRAHQVFDEHGDIIIRTSVDGTGDNKHGKTEEQNWIQYTGRCFAQLEWWAEAAKQQRIRRDPFENSPVFQSSPTQRNAPPSNE